MTAKKVAPARKQFADLTATGATVHHASTLEVGSMPSQMTSKTDQVDLLAYGLPLATAKPDAVVQNQTAV